MACSLWGVEGGSVGEPGSRGVGGRGGSLSWSRMPSRWGQLQLDYMDGEVGKFFKENWTIVTKNGVMVEGQISLQ